MSNNANTYRKYEHTQFHSGMDTQTHCALIFLSLNPPHLELYQSIWLVMHVILPSHIVFLCSRHKHNSECSDMRPSHTVHVTTLYLLWGLDVMTFKVFDLTEPQKQPRLHNH